MDTSNNSTALSVSLASADHENENENKDKNPFVSNASHTNISSCLCGMFALLLLPLVFLALVSMYFVLGAILLAIVVCVVRGPLQFIHQMQKARAKVIQDNDNHKDDTATTNNDDYADLGCKESPESDNAVRHWGSASGTYTIQQNDNDNEDDEDTLQLEFTKAVTSKSASASSSLPLFCWNISGHSSRDHNKLNGLISNPGTFYWVEQHLKKQRLVQGRLDYDTHQLLDCTWIDNQGGSGTYPTFQKKASIEEVGGVTIEEIP